MEEQVLIPVFYRFFFFIIVFLLFICLGFYITAGDYSQVNFEEFNCFKLKYGKTYANQTEEKFRMQIYSKTKELIIKHNQMYDNGFVTYAVAMNQFGDMLSSEYVNRLKSYTDFIKISRLTGVDLRKAYYVRPPDRLDWRREGYVTPVQDQGECNAGYAFASIGAFEGQHFKSIGILVPLSAQVIVDCSVDEGSHGCKGGETMASYRSIYKHGGIESERSYPYTGKNSWGIGWGDKGYIKMARNKKNNCGIASHATTPNLQNVKLVAP